MSKHIVLKDYKKPNMDTKDKHYWAWKVDGGWIFEHRSLSKNGVWGPLEYHFHEDPA